MSIDRERLRQVFVSLGYPHESWRCEYPSKGEEPCDYSDEAVMFADEYDRLTREWQERVRSVQIDGRATPTRR